YVTWSCSATNEFATRTMSVNTDLLNELIGVDDDVYDSYINSSEIGIFLVVIDFAGLPTNINGIQSFYKSVPVQRSKKV
ncbi:hypothetical protein BY458DRAFT_439022, partial [Sporodiniella umbellata]